MRVPWSRESAPAPEPRPEPNTPHLLQLCDDGSLSLERANPVRVAPQHREPDAVH